MPRMRSGMWTAMTCVAVVVAGAIGLQDVAGAQGQTPSSWPQEQGAAGEDRTSPPETPPPNTAARGGLRLPFSDLPDVLGHAGVGTRFRITTRDVGTRQFPGDIPSMDTRLALLHIVRYA
jgi:hypothetical protein